MPEIFVGGYNVHNLWCAVDTFFIQSETWLQERIDIIATESEKRVLDWIAERRRIMVLTNNLF